MAELFPLLGFLAVVLTLIGSYRLFGFFYSNDPVFAGLFSIAATVSFLAVLDYLLIGLGLLVILTPLAVLSHYSDGVDVSGWIQSMSSNGNSENGSASQSDGQSTSQSTGTIQCAKCGEENSVTNRHCDNCGELL